MSTSSIIQYLLTSIGAVAICISLLGYISNKLNWAFLNHGLTHLLYNIGAAVHETSHAIVCLISGAKILEFSIFSRQPHVTYDSPKFPWISNPLISFAPIAGGLAFLYAMNRFALGNYLTMPNFSGWQTLTAGVLAIFAQIHFSDWQAWILILLFINAGAMIGPSWRDLHNVWPILLILLLIHYSVIFNIGLITMALLIINLAIQVVLILISSITKWVTA